MSRVDVLDQHTPFASDEAGPDTTGATAGHVDETDLLDPSVPLDAGGGPPTRTTRACEHGMAVTDPAHADGLQPNLMNASAGTNT